MNRRIVLKHLAVASAAAWLLPACGADPKKVSIALNNLKITGDEEELLGNIADVLIPATDTPGAKEVGAHRFTLVMVDDCMPKPEQRKYLDGMRAFENALKTLTGKSFKTTTPTERLAILTEAEQKFEKLPEDVKTFYSTTRRYIIEGYTSSSHFLTNIKPYQLVPGPDFKGCVPVGINPKTLS